MSQYSNICFTMFSDPMEGLKGNNLRLSDIKYMVYQREIAPSTKKIHYQGYVELARKLSMQSIKKLFNDPTMHIERRRGSQTQARDYCMKTESRDPAEGAGPHEVGTYTISEQGKRYDLEALFDYLMDGHTEKETYLEWRGAAMKYGNLITKTNQVLFGETSKNDAKILRLRWIYGQMGESVRSFAEVPPAYNPREEVFGSSILGCGPSSGAEERGEVEAEENE